MNKLFNIDWQDYDTRRKLWSFVWVCSVLSGGFTFIYFIVQPPSNIPIITKDK